MVYAATTGVITYWNSYHKYYLHILHHAWFDEYNTCLSTEDKHTIVYLLLKQYPVVFLQNTDQLNLIPC